MCLQNIGVEDKIKNTALGKRALGMAEVCNQVVGRVVVGSMVDGSSLTILFPSFSSY